MDRTKPHFDKPRKTAFGEWMTRCRTEAGLRQSDLASILGVIDPQWSNQGRPSELETGKRNPPADIVEGLYSFFRQRLGQSCPPPPTP